MPDLRGKLEKLGITVRNGTERGAYYVTRIGEDNPLFDVTSQELYGMSSEQKRDHIIRKYGEYSL